MTILNISSDCGQLYGQEPFRAVSVTMSIPTVEEQKEIDTFQSYVNELTIAEINRRKELLKN